jgi:hypothetical protein
MPAKHIHTSFGVRPRDHYKTFQWLPLACNVSTEVSPEVLATTNPPRATSCTIWVLAISSSPHISNKIDPKSYKSICTTGCYAKTSLYHILSHAIPVEAHGTTVFKGGRSMKPVLKFGYDNKPGTASYN